MCVTDHPGAIAGVESADEHGFDTTECAGDAAECAALTTAGYGDSCAHSASSDSSSGAGRRRDAAKRCANACHG